MEFEGGKKLVLIIDNPEPTHSSWRTGHNSAGGGMRSLRIMMTVGMVINILEKGDMSIFSTSCGAVECWPSQLENPEQQCYFLKERPEKWKPIWLHEVQEKISCNHLELPLNYHQVMIRYQFRVPPKCRAE